LAIFDYPTKKIIVFDIFAIDSKMFFDVFLFFL